MKFLLAMFAIFVFSISAFAQKPTPTPTPQPFLIAVEDAFYINGQGLVATGKVERGSINTGETVEIVGSNPAKIITVSITAFKQLLTEAKAGDNVGLLLKGLQRGEIVRGQVLAKPGTIKAAKKFEASLDVFAAAAGGRTQPIKDGYRGLFYFRLAGVSGTITLPKGKMALDPGSPALIVTITVEQPVAVENGLIFALREGSRTVGSGKVTKVIE